MPEQEDQSAEDEAGSENDLAGEAGERGEAGGAAPAAEALQEEKDGTGRVLEQDEIDSLLGFEDDSDSDQSGVMAIVNSALVSYERLPMLEVVFDRLVRLMTTSLRNFTSDNVEVSLESITSVRFGDYLNSIPLPAMIGVVNAEEWDGYCLATVDSALIYSIVDVLLGGRRGTAALRIEGRPYTTIERNLVERMLHVVLADLSAAFDPISPVKFAFDRLETNPRFAAVARPANAAIMSRFRIDMEDRGGKVELVIPYATLEPVRDYLLQMFMGEKFGRDTIWENHLATALWNTDLTIDAVLNEQSMGLREIMDLKVGSQIIFNCGQDPDVELRCGGQPLVLGRMGRKGKNIAVRVESTRLEKIRSGQ
jgi:flagellar motor switch protein FliM